MEFGEILAPGVAYGFLALDLASTCEPPPWQLRPGGNVQEENEMSSHAATLKRGAILASIVVSSYALFGHDAWAPQPVVIASPLNSSTTTAAATYINTSEPTTALRWPASWTLGSQHQTGRPCSPADIPANTITWHVIERNGNYARCTTWFADGARLTAGLSGTGSTADATTLSTGEATTVVQFPAAWTYDTTLAAETYCATYAAPAGTAVGAFIIRFGDYAKCGY
jgi:hypothetical protein